MNWPCRLLGHKWETRSLACVRCRKTQWQILHENRAQPTHYDVSEAYWRGVADGRKIDRKRAYLLGCRRGARAMNDRWGAALEKLR